MNRSLVARYLPLVGHVVPTLAIGFGWVIPRSCIAGWNELTTGFGLSVVGTCIAYVLGQRAAASCVRKGSCTRPFAEARRVLRPGGRFVIAYRSDAEASRSFPASVYRFRDEAEVADALRTSGFGEVRTSRRKEGEAVVSFTVAVRPATPRLEDDGGAIK